MLRWECKNMRLVSIFDIFLNPSFKMTTGFTNVATLYIRKDFKSSGIEFLYKK